MLFEFELCTGGRFQLECTLSQAFGLMAGCPKITSIRLVGE